MILFALQMTFQNMDYYFTHKCLLFQLTNNTVCNLSSVVQEAEVSSI